MFKHQFLVYSIMRNIELIDVKKMTKSKSSWSSGKISVQQ